NVVWSTFVSGTYRRRTVNGSVGASSKLPPRSASRSAPNADGESMSGTVSQGIEPFRDTSATVRPSPIAARSRIAGYGSAASVCSEDGFNGAALPASPKGTPLARSVGRELLQRVDEAALDLRQLRPLVELAKQILCLVVRHLDPHLSFTTLCSHP